MRKIDFFMHEQNFYDKIMKMRTLMFVERPENQARMIVDFQYNRYNYHYAPNGIIRIARFTNSFQVKNNDGYYGEIYMKQFIRNWKRKTYENIERRKNRTTAKLLMNRLGFVDIENVVLEFL